MAIMAYWKQAPEVSESAKRFVDVQQCVPGQPLPPPSLPSSIPLNMKSDVNQAVRATKVAWLLESKRVNVTGEDGHSNGAVPCHLCHCRLLCQSLRALKSCAQPAAQSPGDARTCVSSHGASLARF